MGTPAFAVPALEAVAACCDIRAVVTQPDRGKGRGRTSAESEVAASATELGLPVLKPESVNAPAVRKALAALEPDLFAVVAYGGILSPEVLAIPRLGSINLHGSLLPDYRGASPVQRALWDGRTHTGVTTLWMDEGIDTGDVILKAPAPIEAADDAGTLAARLAALGGPLLAESLVRAHAGEAPRVPQDRNAGSYAKKLKKEDGAVDWSLDAETIWNHARAVTPWPGAITSFEGAPLRIEACVPERASDRRAAPGTVLEVRANGVVVAAGSSAVRLTRVRPASRAAMDAAAWARGARVEPGVLLGGGG